FVFGPKEAPNMNEQETGCDADLGQLAQEINAQHGAVITTLSSGVEHARRAGELLLKVKEQVRHGEWLPWLTANCPEIAPRTAQFYMQRGGKVAADPPNAQHVAGLPLRRALFILSQRNSDTPDDPDKLGAGGSDDGGDDTDEDDGGEGADKGIEGLHT